MAPRPTPFLTRVFWIRPPGVDQDETGPGGEFTVGTAMAYAVVNEIVSNAGHVGLGSMVNGGRGMGGGMGMTVTGEGSGGQ